MKFKHLVTDVDGVLTDGGFYYNTEGKVLKKFGPHDSDGFKILKSLGLSLQAISADKRGFPITEKRLNDMGIPISHVTEVDRFCWVEDRFDLSKTIFVGDGYHDIELLKECALGIAPSNSLKIVKENANYVTDSCGNSTLFKK